MARFNKFLWSAVQYMDDCSKWFSPHTPHGSTTFLHLWKEFSKVCITESLVLVHIQRVFSQVIIFIYEQTKLPKL